MGQKLDKYIDKFKIQWYSVNGNDEEGGNNNQRMLEMQEDILYLWSAVERIMD